MDPFHVVRLAGDALDECRRRVQQELHHRRGRATDPLYKAHRMFHTRSCLLTPRQQHQLADLFASDCHVALEVTWSVYQNITWCIPRSQQNPRQGPDASRNSLSQQRGCPSLPHGDRHTRKNAQTPRRGHPGLLRPPPHQQWPHRSDHRPPRTPTQIRTRIPKPHPLHHPNTPQNRRIQTPTTPPIMKSRFAHMLITCKRSVRCWSLLLVIVNFFASCSFRNFARCFEKLRIGVQCII